MPYIIEEEVPKNQDNLKESHFNLTDELIKLKNILDQGILTEEEFKEIKKDLIYKSTQVD